MNSEITGAPSENTAAYAEPDCILGTGTVTVDQSTFTRNIGTQTTGVQGGAIHVGSFDDTLPGVLVVTNSDFTLNQSIWGATQSGSSLPVPTSLTAHSRTTDSHPPVRDRPSTVGHSTYETVPW